MNILPTTRPDVKLLQPQVHGDERGFFMETFRDNWFREHIAPRTFVQENHSKSGKGVLRGLHYQTENTQRQLWVPEGFAHGFYVLSDEAEFVYKCTDYYNPKAEHSLIWNDPTVGIDWPLQGEPNLSPKDLAGKVLAEAVTF